MNQTRSSLLLVVALLIAGQLGWFVGATLELAFFHLTSVLSLGLIPFVLLIELISLFVGGSSRKQGTAPQAPGPQHPQPHAMPYPQAMPQQQEMPQPPSPQHRSMPQPPTGEPG